MNIGELKLWSLSWGITAAALVGQASASEIVWKTSWSTYPVFGGSTAPYRTIAIGYGTPDTTVGDEIEILSTGLYSLSSDPDFSRFLVLATDGTSQDVSLYLDGTFCLTRPEWLFYETGDSPDFTGWGVTGVQLDVVDLDQHNAATVRWEFIGVPEPASILGIGAALAVLHLFSLGRRAIRDS